MSERKIIILTPIKNEAWIIGPFLKACSEFADHIVLLIQDTHDESEQIAKQYPKAVIRHNTSNEFSETERIKQLLEIAREIAPEGAILVALDADEIPINTPESLSEWDKIRQLESCQNICFWKPDLLKGGSSIVDVTRKWALGFVDDLRKYTANIIHSQRVPLSEDTPAYNADAIPLLHVNLVRDKVLRAKRRMYCAIENVKATKPLYQRLQTYSHTIDFSEAGKQLELPRPWKDYLKSVGLDPESIPEDPPLWQDYEVLKLFKEHGTQRFMMDDIWDIDWEQTRQDCRTKGWNEVPENPIAAQTQAQRFFRLVLGKSIRFTFSAYRNLKPR